MRTKNKKTDAAASSHSGLPAMKTDLQKLRAAILLLLSLGLGATAYAQQPSAAEEKSTKAEAPKKLDRSGKPRRGKASFYHHKFAGRKMADGTRMDPNSNVAASKTLPLGTVAKVTNLENGKSEVVQIRDRGPYVQGRIVDLTPTTAKKLDIDDQGVAAVVVEPIKVPQADGSSKRGAGSTVELASGGD
jgi:rare lipoprotein A